MYKSNQQAARVPITYNKQLRCLLKADRYAHKDDSDGASLMHSDKRIVTSVVQEHSQAIGPPLSAFHNEQNGIETPLFEACVTLLVELPSVR